MPLKWAFQVALLVKNLSSDAGDLRGLNWEDPLEKEIATHSSILPGKSHEQRTQVGCSPWGRKELDMT